MTRGKKQLIVAVSGFKDSGKTTLIERLIKYMNEKGYTTATVKHDGHSFQPDREGTDSYRFFQAGTAASVIYDGEKISFTKRCEADIEKIISALTADFVFLEGFKYSEYSKIVIQKNEGERIPLDERCLAVVLPEITEEKTEHPCFLRDDTAGIGELLIRRLKEGE